MNAPLKNYEKTKAHAPREESAPSELQQQGDYKAIRSRSTSTEDQHRKLLALLRMGPQTTYSLRKHGIAQCAARIFWLRNIGHVITTDRVTAVDSDGFSHVGVARYSLVQEALNVDL